MTPSPRPDHSAADRPAACDAASRPPAPSSALSPATDWDPELCEREYNARAAIPDSAAVLAGFAERARAARARLHETEGGASAPLELAYGPGAAERLDLFPVARADEPLLVFIHGGYWRSLDKRDFSWIAPPFLERGIAVAMPNYDFVPRVPMETIVRQMLAALAYLWRNAPVLGFDRNRIVVAGHSAGGHLAAMMACARWPQWGEDLPADLVKGVLTISGLHELEPLRHAPFLARDIALDAERARRMSPALMPPVPGVRVVTSLGGAESGEFHRQARLLAERWPGNVEREVPVPGADHLRVCEHLADPGSALFRAAVDLCLGRNDEG